MRTGHQKLDNLVQLLRDRGWHWAQTGRHNKLTAPNGKTVTMSKTAYDHRAWENAYHVLRRAARAAGEVV